MRKHLYVRPARPGDGEEFLEWSRINPKNGFDPEVAKYPSTITWCVYDEHGPLAYMPMQCPLVMDSLAMRPGSSKAQAAVALKELTQQFVTQAHIRGSGEILFFGTEEGTNAMAENHVFEKLPYSVYRLRIKDLEK
jgi:hypothetical protein